MSPCSERTTSGRIESRVERSVTSGTASRHFFSRRPAARAGEPRTSALIFGRDGDDYLVVASMGGAPEHPQWYRNLTANPNVEIQVKAERIPGRGQNRFTGREAPSVVDREWRVAQLRRIHRHEQIATSPWSC